MFNSYFIILFQNQLKMSIPILRKTADAWEYLDTFRHQLRSLPLVNGTVFRFYWDNIKFHNCTKAESAQTILDTCLKNNPSLTQDKLRLHIEKKSKLFKLLIKNLPRASQKVLDLLNEPFLYQPVLSRPGPSSTSTLPPPKETTHTHTASTSSASSQPLPPPKETSHEPMEKSSTPVMSPQPLPHPATSHDPMEISASTSSLSAPQSLPILTSLLVPLSLQNPSLQVLKAPH